MTVGQTQVALIDNRDSYTYNIAHYVRELGYPCQVISITANNALEQINTLNPSHIILSPGPGHPKDAKLSLKIIEDYHIKIPLLGICLGHQCIGLYFGAQIKHSSTIFHGQSSKIIHSQSGLYEGIPNPLTVTRYHSLALKSDTLRQSFKITALTVEEHEIMSIEHRTLPLFGVQYHPEAYQTERGHQLIANFLSC